MSKKSEVKAKKAMRKSNDRTIDETQVAGRVSGVRGDKSQDIRIKSAQIETLTSLFCSSAMSAAQETDLCVWLSTVARSQEHTTTKHEKKHTNHVLLKLAHIRMNGRPSMLNILNLIIHNENTIHFWFNYY